METADKPRGLCRCGCGRTLDVMNPWARFATKECQKRGRFKKKLIIKNERVCNCGCGVSLEGRIAHTKYASQRCRYRDYKQRCKAGKASLLKDRKPAPCKCGCGKIVDPTKSKKPKVFFNNACAVRYRRRVKAEEKGRYIPMLCRCGCGRLVKQIRGKKELRYYSSACSNRITKTQNEMTEDQKKQWREMVVRPEDLDLSLPLVDLLEHFAASLIVPEGHPKAGQPMALPLFLSQFLEAALQEGIYEAALSVARKNGKSAAVAILCLMYLCGLFRKKNVRIGVASLNKTKSKELLDQIQAISEASNLGELVRFKKSPYPGGVSSAWATVEVLSSDGGGHASSFDLVIFDELGLFQERSREFVASMRSSVSAKKGRVIAISIMGDGPFMREIEERSGEPGVTFQRYSTPEGYKLNDPTGWALSNPGLDAGIKADSYMEFEAARALKTPADESYFRSFDLNQDISPSRSLICAPSDWQGCQVDVLPDKAGDCFLGIDLGGSASMTAAVAYWPESGRLEVWGAFPDTPGIKERSRIDATRYDLMIRQGELELYPGKVTNVGEFIQRLSMRLEGAKVQAVGCDRFRRAEFEQALTDSGVTGWSIVYRGTGAHSKADGSFDCRSFQRAVMTRKVKHGGGLLLKSALLNSSLRFDVGGNPALDRSGQGRIDGIAASVIAVGLSEALKNQTKPGWTYRGVA